MVFAANGVSFFGKTLNFACRDPCGGIRGNGYSYRYIYNGPRCPPLPTKT